MACRIQNLSGHTLHLDLRGGRTLHLKAGEVGPPLREEHLYDNPYVASWERQGLIRRLRASMQQVVTSERLASLGRSVGDAVEDLQRVAEIGPVTAHALVSQGIITVSELAAQDEETLAGVKGIGDVEAGQILDAARNLPGRRRASRKKAGRRSTGEAGSRRSGSRKSKTKKTSRNK